MTPAERLTARGWRCRHDSVWWFPPPSISVDPSPAFRVDDAFAMQVSNDAETIAAHGSVRYVPTDEQATTSPLCAALAAQGVTERDAIEHLFRENETRAANVVRLFAMQPPAPFVVPVGTLAMDLAKAQGRTEGAAECDRLKAIGEAWKALAKARALGGVAAMNARRKAVAMLAEMGIDPEAP